ncbi:LRR receptor-like serine/threonine-protein kinase EFR isoform X2 [Pyrus x bretschneideri]|uniref:LRR receptor-like serine/threonine-protein kinase EFR isoform X2 n=1 Tax=Pyrus x bretschneideri TaxID=225117 RepID=UPI00202E97EB|nr:LRR receptor-like serine/threonine-protein kinase EFR isoform X2 [Pyrus x bretschneideri]XP_048446299.1 LRR receptor-like serine/threonine-protein kinase EFR isoform X2 [Pyrus x bretschneideri]XP_048446300.1 LRR receptor-like serine/threonine-protein kinase EFR isoform X2 [Pyrus x bretschneideri]XP_048446301.1 LRR receptor-like serine/threonine-protein kinase EFR isoform X2 [Pyrus x bretschneideri]XP_048446302.1 LRR receptor-like serine/threonine-protein kinase EFR isoform X2 [Pyrus x bretsc
MSRPWATISSACRWRLEFCSLSLEFVYHRGLQVHSCFISNRGALAIAHTNFSTDQSALLALKAYITSDPQNILTANWSSASNSNICNWVGVTCSARHHRVTALNLSYMGLAGVIPPHLGNLSFLVALGLQNNSFHGPLPQELSHLRRLKAINFGNNNFMGTIPSWFGSFAKLQAIKLYGNGFSGFIPAAIFNLSALETINLKRNQLSGSIPREIGNLTMVKSIYLDYNKFEELPNEIGSLGQLEELFVQNNALKGSAFVPVLNISSLTTLTLSGNNMSGSLPDNICEHLSSIRRLNLAQNQLDGLIPFKLWQCKELRQLVLAVNDFRGSIPKSLGNFTYLTDIILFDNNLTGTIPDEICDLPQLERLDLFSNNLNGVIPSKLFNNSMIRQIGLSFNQLSGSLPANIGLNVPNLEILDVAKNNLVSELLPNLSNASKLRVLDMNTNSFTGFLPSTLCSLKNLERLYLYLNHLTIDASTPQAASTLSCLFNLRNLKDFDLGDNPLNTTIPASRRNLSTSLLYFDLMRSNIRGNIPVDIANFSSLIEINLGNNQLSGAIPTSIQRLQNLQALYLNDNELQGHVPYELCQLNNLVELLLAGNRLSGSIPSCLGTLAGALRDLSLDSNLLTSKIPSSLWELKHILFLNLSSNSLVGPLSEDIGKLEDVVEIDLSNNHFSGNIPDSIGGLLNMINLSLANNYLEGHIPSSFKTLLSLEFLDLSKNNLSGVIPKSLEALLSLKHLNLSFNKLQGEIPTGGPFGNFFADSFVSNDALCGAPRFHVPLCKNRTKVKPNWRKAKYIISGVISVILLVAAALILILRKKRNVEVVRETASLHQVLWRRVSHLELVKATNGFHESNLLGTGGFGSVYKGTLSDGIDIAVKVFNLQLEGAFKSFDKECEILSNIRHRNLIKIISCCDELDFKALILQLMPNGSLDNWLYSPTRSMTILQRLDIMKDVALALEYLHHGYSIPIVHCDVKPSNILLDDDMVAHVADFGIARLIGSGDSMTETMTLATVGYMAPEYGMEGSVSTRGDVYSFGIVLMETFTKRKPTDKMFVGELDLKQWIADSLFPDAAIGEVVDADILGVEEDGDFVSRRDCLLSVMRLALACSAALPGERINMKDAAITLTKIKTKYLKDCGGMN